MILAYASGVSYSIAQSGDADSPTDLQWVCTALCRLESGWRVEDGILYSPHDTQIRSGIIRETLANGRDAMGDRLSPASGKEGR